MGKFTINSDFTSFFVGLPEGKPWTQHQTRGMIHGPHDVWISSIGRMTMVIFCGSSLGGWSSITALIPFMTIIHIISDTVCFIQDIYRYFNFHVLFIYY